MPAPLRIPVLILALMALLLPWAAPALEIGDAHFASVGDAEVIPDNNVTALAQDRAGFLWIGTPSGLIRYDGYRFRLYARDPLDPHSLGGVFIRALLVTADGRLWVATDADGVSVYDPVTGHFKRYRHDPQRAPSLAHDQVLALVQDRDGTVWVGTREGLDRFDAVTDSFEHVAKRFGADTVAQDERVFALLVDRVGDLWVGAWNGLSRRSRRTGEFARMGAGDQALAGQQVFTLLELTDGRIGVGTAQMGSFLIDPKTTRLQGIPVGLTKTPSATESQALAMIQPRPEELWLAAFGGITVVDLASGRVLRQHLPDPSIKTSLTFIQVRAFLADRAGDIWIGGYGGGLQRHDPRNLGVRVLHHSPARTDALSSPSISSVLELANGEIWFGTRGKGIDVFELGRGVVRNYRADPDTPTALGNGMVMSLAQTTDGSVYAGTLAGMYRFDPESSTFSSIGTAQGLIGTTVRCMLADPGGDLWIGSNIGLGRWRAASGKIDPVGPEDGAPLAADVNTLAREANGRLWVGTGGGLYVLEPGAAGLRRVRTQSGASEGLTDDAVVGLLVDTQGQVWLDTDEGLNRLLSWDGQFARLDAVSARLGIGGRPFGANLLEDAQGRIWTQRHVLDPATDTVYELGRADGIDFGTAWFRSKTKTRSGLLLFGGNDGVAVIDPSRFTPAHHVPPVVASELRVDGVSQPAGAWSEGLVVPAGNKTLSVEFAALDFSAPQRIRYAYRLEGFDADWIETDAGRRLASYNNLWPGDYALWIRASNRNGAWTEQPLRIPVRVLRQYWQTPWFAALVLFALALSIYLLYRLKLARIRAHERELQQMVALRTREFSDARERAEIALAQLKGAQRQLVAAEKMASLGQLVAGVAHEINTPLGIALTAASVQSEELQALHRSLAAHTLKASDLESYVATAEHAGRLVDVHLARAAHLVRSFKQVSVDRSLDERRRFVLIDYLKDLIESLEISWKKRRPIKLELECEPTLVLDSYPGTLGQIIATFAQNALLHAYAEGAAGSMCIEARALDGNRVQLSFTDDGKGIEPADLAHIFEPFFTTARIEGCVGLGLHVVFNLVNVRLCGTVEVSSTPGTGTRFTLIFPRDAPE